MDYCFNSIKRTPIIEALPNLVKTQRGGSHVSLANIGFSSSPRKSTLKSKNMLKIFDASESGQQIYVRRRKQPLFVAVASAESRGCKSGGIGTPLKPSSPEGDFLSGILQNQRHLFQFAVSEQLGELAANRDGAAAHKNQSLGSMESLLRRRIAEMKENECQIAVEDVMYMSIVHKFSKVDVPMVPKLSKCITDNTLEIWPSKCRELESIHSLEVLEMIRHHLATILRMRGKSSTVDGQTTTKIDRLHLGRIYASSIMYGYFLKSACLRRRLDLSCEFKSLVTLGESTEALVSSASRDSQMCDRNENLSSYVTGFDSESLQRCAKLKSKEAVNVIEKQTWALFGGENIGALDSDNNIVITFLTLKRLVLEAVTFGSFLWDVERSVDALYVLKEN